MVYAVNTAVAALASSDQEDSETLIAGTVANFRIKYKKLENPFDGC